MISTFDPKKNEEAWQHYFSILEFRDLMGKDRNNSCHLLFDAGYSWCTHWATRRSIIKSMTPMDSNVLMSRNAAEYGIDPFQPQRQFIKKLRWWEPRDDLYKATQKDLELNEPEYGPLLQWFVREGERENWDESRLCKAIKDWSFTIPSQTTEYKKRKKIYPAVYKPPNLIPYFKKKLEWQRTADLNKPWEAVAGTEHLQLRLNDFPDEILYTLMVDGRAIGDFNDFRSIWKR